MSTHVEIFRRRAMECRRECRNNALLDCLISLLFSATSLFTGGGPLRLGLIAAAAVLACIACEFWRLSRRWDWLLRCIDEEAKMMTEAEAWRYLGELWEAAAGTAVRGRFPRVSVRHDILAASICVAVMMLRYAGRTQCGTEERMKSRLRLLKPGHRGIFWWDLDREGAQCRALACYLLAEMAEEEA